MIPQAWRIPLAALALILAGCSAPAPPFPAGEVVDLSHAFDEDTIYWPTADGFRLETVFDGETTGAIGCLPTSLPQMYCSTSLDCTTRIRYTTRNALRPS